MHYSDDTANPKMTENASHPIEEAMPPLRPLSQAHNSNENNPDGKLLAGNSRMFAEQPLTQTAGQSNSGNNSTDITIPFESESESINVNIDPNIFFNEDEKNEVKEKGSEQKSK